MTISEVARMGGHARAAKLTQQRLSEIGTKAVTTRWRKNKNKQTERTKRKKGKIK